MKKGTSALKNPANDLDETESLEAAKLLFSHLDSQITLADTKAALVMTANTILAAGMSQLSQKGMVLTLWSSVSQWSKLAAGFGLVSLVAILCSIFLALHAAMPNLKAPSSPSPFYFGSIDSWSIEDFVSRFDKQSPSQICTALLLQIHVKSNITVVKFERLQASLRWLQAAVIFWALSLIALGLVKP